MKRSSHGLRNIHISSAGIYAYEGNPADPSMVKYLQEKNIPVGEHSASQITKDDVDQADIILVMEKSHFMVIEETWPEAREKIKLLGEYVSSDQSADDIVDPYGRSSYHYRLAQSQITLAVKAFAKTIQGY